MRILHVIPGVSRFFGGPSHAIVQICRGLKREGADVEIATSNADVQGVTDMPTGRPVDLEGVRVHCFHSPAFRKYGYSPGLPSWLGRHAGDYDVLHVHALFAHITWPASRHAVAAGRPYVLRPLGQLNPAAFGKSRAVKELYLRLWGRRSVDRAAAIQFTTRQEQDNAAPFGFTSRPVVIPHGLELGELPPRGAFRRRHPGVADKQLIVFLSRLDPIKGLDQLLPALRTLRDRRDDFALVIAGRGPEGVERGLRRQVAELSLSDRVLFVGFLEGREKWELLCDGDLFVLPSYSENFGMAAVEAMAASVPLLISSHVGLHHEVRDAGAGIVTEDNRTADWIEPLGRLLDDPRLRRRMGDNGRRLVEARLQVDSVSRRLIALYESIV